MIDDNAVAALPTFNAAGMSHQQAAAFLDRLKRSVKASDRKGLAAVVNYPLSVSLGGTAMTISRPEQFLKHYSEILTPKVEAAIANQKPENLFANDGGIMIGDGEVWFRCPDGLLTKRENGSYACDDGDIRIVTINNR